MALPKLVRRLAPDRVRDDVRVRALFVGTGLIPPRTMHSEADAAVLRRMAHGRRRAVEIGVYEGASALILCAALPLDAELHLIDPFGHHASSLPSGWGATERASKRVVARAVRRRGGPRVTWHVDFSAALAGRWRESIDFVFIDGDHSELGVSADWEGWSEYVVEGGAVVFHDARLSRPGGRGLPGPTAVVDRLFRGPRAVRGWEIEDEADRTVAVVRRAEAA